MPPFSAETTRIQDIINQEAYGVALTMGVFVPDQRGPHRTAFLIRHENTDTHNILNENGEMIIAEVTPKGYSERGRTQVIEPSNTTNAGITRSMVWSDPAFANRTLFVRIDNKLVAGDSDANSYR